MNMYEEGRVKGQKLSKKQLASCPEFKQQYLQPIQNLPSAFQIQVLSSMTGGEMSMMELRQAATRYRSLRSIEKAFCRYTNTSWPDAQRRFPMYTAEEHLNQFTHLNFTKGVLEAYTAFCQAALRSEASQAGDNSIDVYSFNRHKAFVLKGDIQTLTYSTLREAGVPFNGAHLFVAFLFGSADKTRPIQSPNRWSSQRVCYTEF